MADLTELQLLTARPDRFETAATLQSMNRLAGAVAAFCGLLARDNVRVARQALKGLAGEVTAAAAAVRRDEERILRSL
jgi:hypothetical protein